MQSAKNSRADRSRGSFHRYFTTGFGSTSAGFLQLSGYIGETFDSRSRLGRDQYTGKKTGLFPK
jgi:hypothetical protein